MQTTSVKPPSQASDDQSVSSQSIADQSDARFVEAVFGVQNLVSAGAPAQEAYQAVVDNAVHLLVADSASLRFRDLKDPEWMVAAAAHGVVGN